jgi:hypothetical protein
MCSFVFIIRMLLIDLYFFRAANSVNYHCAVTYWKSTVCYDSSSTVNSQQEGATRAVPRKGSRTTSRPTFNGQASSPGSSRMRRVTGPLGEQGPEQQCSPSRKSDASVLLLHVNDATGPRKHQMHLLFHGPPVTACVPQTSASGATYVSIDDNA